MKKQTGSSANHNGEEDLPYSTPPPSNSGQSISPFQPVMNNSESLQQPMTEQVALLLPQPAPSPIYRTPFRIGIARETEENSKKFKKNDTVEQDDDLQIELQLLKLKQTPPANRSPVLISPKLNLNVLTREYCSSFIRSLIVVLSCSPSPQKAPSMNHVNALLQILTSNLEDVELTELGYVALFYLIKRDILSSLSADWSSRCCTYLFESLSFHFRSSSQLVSNGCGTIAMLCFKNESNGMTFGELGIYNLLYEILGIHKFNEQVVMRVNEAFRNVSSSNYVSEKGELENYCQVLFECLQIHRKSPGIVKQLSVNLGYIALVNPDLKNKLKKLRVEEILLQHAGDSDHKQFALKCLK